ncbi:nuclear transcription factor Y subunit C-2 isoform X2 [Prunus yedoensis var. nudiflora]|uniref:Nuclear transcription factor Y subunit C-2 isoform X2 n=1 Tax=Prunus yedoensis var. nudiflora TaxID=2094558 RepID=A0A314Z348_PRUYE|nr:nuclear transcription factor Y subunit C-2 isoform X2 [Prunus yedoensis var. nudiflora]
MVSSETPVLFSKACELFIMELTLRSWLHTERSKRRTLQYCDTARAIMQDALLHFYSTMLIAMRKRRSEKFLKMLILILLLEHCAFVRQTSSVG